MCKTIFNDLNYFLHVYLFLIAETNTVVGEALPPAPSSEYQTVKLQYNYHAIYQRLFQRCLVTSLLLIFKARSQTSRACSPLPSAFVSSKNYHERSTKPHNTQPLSVIGSIFFGFEWLVVPFVFVCDLGA